MFGVEETARRRKLRNYVRKIDVIGACIHYAKFVAVVDGDLSPGIAADHLGSQPANWAGLRNDLAQMDAGLWIPRGRHLEHRGSQRLHAALYKRLQQAPL
jgi:hypothetical protein